MKRELPRKVTKEDVLRLLAKAIKDMSEKLKAPDDAMMVGRVPYRCIACNNTAGMHGKQADKVVHAGLSPVSATDVSRHSVIVLNCINLPPRAAHFVVYLPAASLNALMY